MKSKLFILPFLLLTFIAVKGQGFHTKKLKGRLLHPTISVEGVHVINKTSGKNTITNKTGDFQTVVSLNDTIVFSAVQFKLHTLIVTTTLLETLKVQITMEERVNELDEVIVRNHNLSGDPAMDVKNATPERTINFYDVGIPGYKGAPPTQSERRLIEATTGAGLLPLNPILNGISGRTKMLKQRIALEKKDKLAELMSLKFEQILIDAYHLRKGDSYEFFLFAADDPDFEKTCRATNDVERLEFLIDRVKAYLKLKKNDFKD